MEGIWGRRRVSGGYMGVEGGLVEGLWGRRWVRGGYMG